MKRFQKPYETILSAKIHWLGLLAGVLFFTSCGNSTRQNTSKQIGPSDSVKVVLKLAASLMDEGKFESSQELLLQTLEKRSSTLNVNPYDIYFLHSYLAEIMYYTALNEQGLQNAGEALTIAKQIKNDTLLGNAYNLLGLIHLNSERYDTALRVFNEALNLLPPGINISGISRYDHVLANISEVYLHEKMPDSALHFARLAMVESKKLKSNRAIMLNHWTLAEAFFQKGLKDSVTKHLELAAQNPDIQRHPDVRLFLFTTQVKNASAGAAPNSLQTAIQQGAEIASTIDHEFAIQQFYLQVVKTLLDQGNYQEAAHFQQKLNDLRESIRKNREQLHMRLLRAFYKNEQELALEKASRDQQQRLLEQNRIIQIVLGILIVLLILVLILSFRWVKQRRRIELYRFNEEKADILKQQELQRLTDRFTTLEEERNRIAREIHDDIGSSMGSISIFTDLALQEIERNPSKSVELMMRVKSRNQEIAESISDLIWAIYSKNDTWANLITRIRNFCFEVLTTKGIEVVISDDYRLQDTQLPIHYKKNLLLILKEAIHNISKYSEATRVEINIRQNQNQIELSVIDNGKGFDTEVRRTGNGVNGFQLRARAINGQLKIKSAPGQGTQILLTFPA